MTGGSGTYLNKPLWLSAPANLFLLSPGGIWIGPGAKISNAQTLLLTTSLGMKLGRSYFNVLSTSKSDINSLNQGPNLNFSELGTPDGNPYSLGLMGSGSIVLEGGLISVDRNLLLNATGGNLRTVSGSQTQLHAGNSIWLTGHQVDLNDVSITAGQPGQWGLIDVRSSASQDATQQGSISMNNTRLKGQQILITSGDISLNKSRLEAPKGWIQLVANNSSDPTKGISISNSILDVSAYNLDDLNAPALKGGPTELEPIRTPYPRIGLFSSQNIYVSNNSLINASSSVAEFIDNKPLGKGLDLFKIADRSGVVFLNAGGKILIDSSTVSTDSSNTMAGQIYLQADGKDQLGGIYVESSKLFSRYGAGGGRVTFISNGGIAIKNSTIDVSTNRFPIVNGEKYAKTGDGVFPYIFSGGIISLFNKSASNSIQIKDNSSLLALSSTAGGGLESPLLSLAGNPTNLYGMFGNLPSFTLGPESITGGRILVSSNFGINITNSALDVSGGHPPYENLSGVISLADTSQSGIELRHSLLSAMAGRPQDLSNQDTQPGQISLSAEGNIFVDHTRILTNNLNDANILNFCPGCTSPFIAFQSNNSLLFNNSTLQASYIKDPSPISKEYEGINLYAGKNYLIDEETLFNPKPLMRSSEFLFNPKEVETVAIEYTAKQFSSVLNSYQIANLARVREQNQNLSSNQFTSTNHIQHNSLLASRNSQLTSINLDQDIASSNFMETQSRSMSETIKALGLSPRSGKLRSIAELQQRLSLASKKAASAQILAPTQPARTTLIGSSRNSYTPAILRLRRDNHPSGTTRISAILLTAQGEPISRSRDVSRADLDGWIRSFQLQISRRSQRLGATTDLGRILSETLIAPLLPSLRQQGITALLLEVDRGLQAIPYGALPVTIQGREALLSEVFALTITPSLGLIDLDPGSNAHRPQPGQQGRNGLLLLAGASQFSNGLSPLPMVRQELQALAQQESPSHILLNETFTPAALVDQVLTTPVRQLHIATHASFLPGESSTGLLYTPTSTLSLAELGRRLRSRDSNNPLDLLTLSGCVTALGDEQSELGFVGMALQAGARSGIGTLWEVDDTATAAFFIQLYRYLKLGLPKDQALQATQQSFLRGEVILDGDRLVGPVQLNGTGKTTLVSGLSREEQTHFSQGLRHPYYWAGMVLSGNPW